MKSLRKEVAFKRRGDARTALVTFQKSTFQREKRVNTCIGAEIKRRYSWKGRSAGAKVFNTQLWESFAECRGERWRDSRDRWPGEQRQAKGETKLWEGARPRYLYLQQRGEASVIGRLPTPTSLLARFDFFRRERMRLP